MRTKILKRGMVVSLSAIMLLTSACGSSKVSNADSNVAGETVSNNQTADNNSSELISNALVIDESTGSVTVPINASDYTDNKDVADTVNKILSIESGEDSSDSEPVKILSMDELNIATDNSSEKEAMGHSADVVDVEESTSQNETVPEITGTLQTAVSNYEIPMASYGIDVSKWQGDINWTAVKASGITFAMIKIAGRSISMDGSLYIDSYAAKNIQEAQAAGIQVGVYFFSQAVNVVEAYQEACLVVNLLSNYNITFPVAFDWESSSDYRVAAVSNDKATMNLIASTFCNTVQSYGYEPMVYACASDYYNTYDSATLSAKYKLWMARYYNSYYYTSQIYAGERPVPSESFTYKMWQFGVSDVVAGINGYVDMDLGFFAYIPIESPMAINVPVAVLNVPVGTNYNLMTGVTAVSYSGADATAYVKYSVTNIFGVDVTPEVAYSMPGTYTVKYSLIDATGLYKQVCIPLIVQ